jgi:hypothetical protein
MSFLDDLLAPVSTMLEDWCESGLIWAILAGVVILVLWLLIKAM